jgi:hypothetical protein
MVSFVASTHPTTLSLISSAPLLNSLALGIFVIVESIFSFDHLIDSDKPEIPIRLSILAETSGNINTDTP